MTQIAPTSSSNSQSALAAANDLRAVMQGKVVLLLLAPTWSGGPAEGERIIAGLQSLGRPLLAMTCPMAYCDLLGMYDAHVVNGRHYAVQTRWVSAPTPEVISTLIAGGSNRTSPLTAIALHQRQKWDPYPVIRPDRQRLGLISCIFGLNSFLNIDRSVKQ
jgi:hypothetical protein